MAAQTRAILLVGLIALCVCTSATEVEDLKTTCATITKSLSKYTPEDSSSYQRCTYCEYAYNSEDNVFGGCASCPNASGECSSCRTGFILHDSLCIPCGAGVEKCAITNDVSKDESIIKLISDITASTTIVGERSKKLAKINAYAKYLGLRASTCSWSSSSDSGTMVELGSFCLKIENCQEASKKDNTVTCTACKPGHYLENGSCSNVCQANLITYESSKYTYSNTFTCNGCNSKKCSACPSGTVEVTSPSTEVLAALDSNTIDNSLKICQKCPSTCSSCKLDSSSNVTCNVCQDGYFNDNGSCTKCTLSADYLLFPEQISLASQSVFICSGQSFNSFTWSSSTFYQTDAYSTKIGNKFKTSNQKAFNCGVGADDCELLNNGELLSAKSCIKGYILSRKQGLTKEYYECSLCSSLVKNSLHCEYDIEIGYYPYVCAVGKKTGATYTDSYYLQVNLEDYKHKDSAYDAQTGINDTNNWCQLNKANCKTMVTVVQTGQNFAFGQCSSCFEDSDIPVENRLIEKDFFTFENPISCLRCTDLYENVQSCEVKDKTLIPSTCKSSYYLDVASQSCKACSSTCATCGDASTCLSCPSTHYLTSSKTCVVLPAASDSGNTGNTGSTPVTSTLKPIEGCSETTQVTENSVDYLSCLTCKTTYNQVSKADSVIKTCELKTVNVYCSTTDSDGNCTACIQDSTTNYVLLNGKCVTIPTGCSKYDGTSCTICDYGYKLSNGSCSSCYSSVQTPTLHVQYDCPVSLQNNNDKATDDTGYGVKSTNASIIAAVSSLIFAILACL